jgi:hypothetical protein
MHIKEEPKENKKTRIKKKRYRGEQWWKTTVRTSVPMTPSPDTTASSSLTSSSEAGKLGSFAMKLT